MNIRLLTAGAAATLTSICLPPAEPIPTTTIVEQGPPPTMPVEPCPATTWSTWDTIPDCDLDGSQTWILSQEIPLTDLDYIRWATECHDMGGVWAYDDYDAVTIFCIDIDY